jgi:hypothetical protein
MRDRVCLSNHLCPGDQWQMKFLYKEVQPKIYIQIVGICLRESCKLSDSYGRNCRKGAEGGWVW